jgi:hypothetical protein
VAAAVLHEDGPKVRDGQWARGARQVSPSCISEGSPGSYLAHGPEQQLILEQGELEDEPTEH